jgi:DNA repair protein REV1
MDCFFVSVGLRNYPHLVGKPVAVTHSKGQPGSGSRSNSESIKIEIAEYEKRRNKTVALNDDEDISHDHDKIKNVPDIYGGGGGGGGGGGMSMAAIASCSYEARARGVKNGTVMGSALKLCPDLQTIPYDFESYQQVAKTLYDTVAQYTLDIQAVSCDEMLVDLNDVIQSCSISPEDFAEQLRHSAQLTEY